MWRCVLSVLPTVRGLHMYNYARTEPLYLFVSNLYIDVLGPSGSRGEGWAEGRGSMCSGHSGVVCILVANVRGVVCIWPTNVCGLHLYAEGEEALGDVVVEGRACHAGWWQPVRGR